MEWRVFFIGPMGIEKASKSGKGTAKPIDYREHLPKLHKFLVTYLKNEHGYQETKAKTHQLTKGDVIDSVTLKKGKGKNEDRITVLNPFNLYGLNNIPANVFDAIDDSDLIIADMSGDKPAVSYELAFTHALGIQTILVSGSTNINFYLNQIRYFTIDFSAKTISSVDLEYAIDEWLANRNKRFDSRNPLTDFYGAPLPDISAATGLATGFYDNFAGPVLESGEIIYRSEASKKKVTDEVRKLKGLIVVRPENFEDTIEALKSRLEAELITEFGPNGVLFGKPNVIFIQTKEGPRTPFFLVNDYLIDIPRTMFSLKLSPRLERISDKDQTLRHNMEGVLVERFFEGIKHRLKKDRSLKDEIRKFHYGSIEEVIKIIKTGKSNTWD